MSARTILVLGGTGKTGRRVVQRLRSRGMSVRVGSRLGEPRFDWDDPATWHAALAHVDAVYIAYYPDLAVPGEVEEIRSFTDLAVTNGVRRLVLLSNRGEPEAQRCERIVRLSGVEWTVLRASWFNQNFSEGYLLESLLAGDVALPAGNVGEPFIDADDVADVAVAALTENGHRGRIYELSGLRLWTFPQAVAEIARVTGRGIRYTQLSGHEYVSTLRRAEVPALFVGLRAYLFAEVLDGRNAIVTAGVMQALGRAPRDFGDYVRETARTGVWNVRRAAAAGVVEV